MILFFNINVQSGHLKLHTATFHELQDDRSANNYQYYRQNEEE